MMRTTTVRFQGYKGSARYTCPCDTCGKELKRTVTVEHTLNPFNKDADGNVKDARQVWRDAQAAATEDAAKRQGHPQTCRTCEERPAMAKLAAMALEPNTPVDIPQVKFWGTPLHTLLERGLVDYHFYTADPFCGAEALKITRKGIERAAKLRPDQVELHPLAA